MLTLRPTKKLAKQLGLRIPPTPPPIASRVADWCVHTFLMEDGPWLIFCNTASLYPIFAKATGIKDDESLVRRSAGMILQVLRDNRHSVQADMMERELAAGVQWAPIPDRSVLSSISELIWLAEGHFDDVGLTPAVLSHRLGTTPMSILGMNNPTRAFTSLHA